MLDIPKLPRAARVAHVIPGLNSHSLISAVTLCNAGCEVKMTMIDVTVKYRGKVILTGRKCTRTGLWMVPLTMDVVPLTKSTINTANFLCEKPPTNQMFQPEDFYYLYDPNFGTRKQVHQANSLIPTSTKGELARYYHQCIGSPPKSAILRALRNHPDELESFPGFNKSLMKYLPASPATAKGHMVRVRKGLKSTKSNRQDILVGLNLSTQTSNFGASSSAFFPL